MQFKTATPVIFALLATVACAAVIPANQKLETRAENDDGVDFGNCTPTMDFQTGRPGRKANQGTFLGTDDKIGGQDALNPLIIAKRICDQLTNVCDANKEAKDVCKKAEAKIKSLGTKDASTADAFNSALGF